MVASEAQSLILENNLIKEYRPRFNVRLKDDKSYPSIAVTLAEPFPRVLVTRRRDIPGARYYRSVHRRGPAPAHAGDHPPALHRPELRRRSARRVGASARASTITSAAAGRRAWAGSRQADYRRMVEDVVDFLEGRTGDVRQKVREAMLAASGREDYERAKEMRDALRWLERLEEPASVEVIGTGDADVVGYARDGDDAVGVLIRVREGRVVGREHRFLEGLEEEADGAVLSAFLVRYYVPSEARARRVVVPFPPDDWDALRELAPRGGLDIPQRGTAHRWLELADHNARHLLESLRIESFETEERAEDPVYALGRDLGLNAVPRSLVCVDISHNQGRDTVGSLVWFEAGRPKKSEYRKFRIQGLGQQDDFAAIHEVITRYLTRRRDEATAAARPHRDRRRQGPAQRRARRDGQGGPRADPDGEPGQARGGSVPARAARRACGCRAAAHRCGCCSARATRRTGSAWPTTGSAAPGAPSPRSCSTSPAWARTGGAGCWSASAAWRA